MKRFVFLLSFLVAGMALGDGSLPLASARLDDSAVPPRGQVESAAPLDHKVDAVLRISLQRMREHRKRASAPGTLSSRPVEELRLDSLPAVLEARDGGGYLAQVTVRAADLYGALQAIESVGGTWSTVAEGRIAARVPEEMVEELAAFSAVDFVSGNTWTAPLMDLSRPEMKVDAVQAGTGLTKAYKGSGVVVGVADSGIDWTHPDFKDASGKSRILYLWDMSRSGKPPSGFTHGYEYTKADIDAGICTEIDGTGAGGHGTHVTGSAAGNGTASSSDKERRRTNGE